MTPGPTLIMKAPGCVKPVKFATIASGNNFGATYWTDGKQEAPMLPDEPWLRVSPAEKVIFWSDECEEIGQIGYFSQADENHEWNDLVYAEEPSEDDYFRALQSGIAGTPDKERYIRMRLWWQASDPFRQGRPSLFSEAQRNNLQHFESILSDDDDNQRLMKAEALRQLSRFEDALRLLDGDFPEGYAHAVSRIRDLAAKGESNVAKLT